MLQPFPFVKHHFGVFFLSPQYNFNANFQKVDGLGFNSGTQSEKAGGINGFNHSLTDHGTYSNLTLSRGLTHDKLLFDWCESTHNSLKTKPTNVLVSLLNKQNLPVKNWLIFNAIPKSWSGGALSVSESGIMVETISFTYQNFILI